MVRSIKLAEPATLIRLQTFLVAIGADIDMNKYVQLGIRDGDAIFDNLLKKNLQMGIVGLGELPPIELECICGQEIRYNCLIRHIESSKIYIIGSCCYKALALPEERKQMCTVEGCSNRHSNKKYILCNTHKADVVKSERKKKRSESARERLGNTRFGFGRDHVAKLIKDVPVHYMAWLRRNDIWNNRIALLAKYHTDIFIPGTLPSDGSILKG